METMRSLHFRRKPLVERHLQRWTGDSLRNAIALLQTSLLQTPAPVRSRRHDRGEDAAGYCTGGDGDRSLPIERSLTSWPGSSPAITDAVKRGAFRSRDQPAQGR